MFTASCLLSILWLLLVSMQFLFHLMLLVHGSRLWGDLWTKIVKWVNQLFPHRRGQWSYQWYCLESKHCSTLDFPEINGYFFFFSLIWKVSKRQNWHITIRNFNEILTVFLLTVWTFKYLPIFWQYYLTPMATPLIISII